MDWLEAFNARVIDKMEGKMYFIAANLIRLVGVYKFLIICQGCIYSVRETQSMSSPRSCLPVVHWNAPLSARSGLRSQLYICLEQSGSSPGGLMNDFRYDTRRDALKVTWPRSYTHIYASILWEWRQRRTKRLSSIKMSTQETIYWWVVSHPESYPPRITLR